MLRNGRSDHQCVRADMFESSFCYKYAAYAVFVNAGSLTAATHDLSRVSLVLHSGVSLCSNL